MALLMKFGLQDEGKPPAAVILVEKEREDVDVGMSLWALFRYARLGIPSTSGPAPRPSARATMYSASLPRLVFPTRSDAAHCQNSSCAKSSSVLPQQNRSLPVLRAHLDSWLTAKEIAPYQHSLGDSSFRKRTGSFLTSLTFNDVPIHVQLNEIEIRHLRKLPALICKTPIGKKS
jgi:hypothetical protein